MAASASFYWHDYETFGRDPALDRPVQFAGIRTDAQLNEIGEPLDILCRLPEDYLPHPGACLIHGITPQRAKEILGEVENAVAKWRETGRRLGMTNRELDSFEDAFEHEERQEARKAS